MRTKTALYQQVSRVSLYSEMRNNGSHDRTSEGDIQPDVTENNSTVQESIKSDESEQPEVATRCRFTNNPYAVLMNNDDDYEEEDGADDASTAPQAHVSRSDRTIRQPARLIKEIRSLHQLG